MTSSKRRPDRPIGSVELRVSFRADKDTAERLKAAIPDAKMRGGELILTIKGDGPAEVEAKAKEVLDAVRESEVKALRSKADK